MEGYVYKWTNFIRGYKTRYLVLMGHQLFCYKKKNDTKSKIYDLKVCKIADDKKKTFIIETNTNDKLYFKTNTENEKKEWIIKLLESSKPHRQSIASEKEKINVKESLTELRKSVFTQLENKTIAEPEKIEFTLKKTDSCVVEKHFDEADNALKIDDYLQNSDLNINPQKNKRFSTAYNIYYQEINKNRAKLRLNKFEKLVNSHQNNLFLNFHY